MRHQVAAATSGRECVLTASYFLSFSFQASKSSNPSPSRRRGLGLSVSHQHLAVLLESMVHYCAISHHERPVRPACWLAVGDGMGAGSTAACRVGLLCRALAGTGGQRPVNSMLHHDGMHAGQIPRVQGRGTASLNTSRPRMLACSASSTCNESRALGPRRLRAQT